MAVRDIPPAVLDRIMAGALKEARALAAMQRVVWTPQAGPQAVAYASTADIIGYGGAAGGGKSDLLLGKAGTQHRRSIIFRRVFPSLRGMIERSREIFNSDNDAHSKDSFNESLHVWRLADGRMVEFGAVQHEQDRKKYQGQPHDFIGIDEATEFPESFVRFLMGWNRTTVPGQRCQTMLTFNPPLDDAGAWVVRFFAPWLDEDHPNPAADGELRWFAMVKGKEVECAGPEPFESEGETVTPKSRTFFHASLKDNPALASQGYGATIDAMPEPLRSLLRGNFHAARMVDPWQTIPVAWVKAAQKRWTETPPMTGPRNQAGQLTPEPHTVTGVDPARGGGDQMVIARLHGSWLAPLETHPGVAVPDGPTGAALLVNDVLAGVRIGVDVIGIGGSVVDSLNAQEGALVQSINFGAGAQGVRDRTGLLKFRNIRAAAHWKFREALDPDHGDEVALPPDTELLIDLTASRYKLTVAGVQIEDKDDIKERIGRSPDKGDAVVLAWWTALYGTSDLVAW